LECGHQKGGNYFCWFCETHATRGDDLAYVLNAKITSIQEKIDSVLATENGKSGARSNKSNYFDRLDKSDLIAELHERGVLYFSWFL
jgi:hypothetical protein